MGSAMLGAALRLFTFVRGEGALGALYYAAFLALWTLCCLPTTPLEVAAGFTFSPALSICASVAGKTGGSLAAFALGRAVAARFAPLGEGGAPPPSPRSSAPAGLAERARRLGRHLQAALLARPAQTIAMVRASPMPIALKNYGLAALPERLVPARTFALVSACVNVPYSVAWSLTGSSAGSLQDALSGQPRGGGGAALLKLGALAALLGGLGLFARRCSAELERGGPRGGPARAKSA